MTRDAASTPPAMGSAERLALAGILLLALGLRGWFAHFDPSPRRFFDEQFALENVGSFLVTGELAPANGYHPSLSYLPQMVVLVGLQRLADLTERPALRALRPEPPIGRGANRPAFYPFTPLAYLLGRWTQALIGTVAVALTFAIGRRLGGPGAALVAAALAAVSPQLVRQSALINEDAALVATVLGAVLTAARAGVARSWRSYLVAGAAVGLACSAKFNGVAAALPLLAVTAARPRDLRGWGRLAGAGLTAAGLFLLLNPFLVLDPERYATDFGRTVVHYGKKADAQEGTHLGVLVAAGAAALDPAFLGPATGTAALLGLALLLRRAATGPLVPGAAALGIVAFALGYPLLYAVATRGVSRHNWLPLLPLLALAAAYSLHAATRWAEARTGWPLLGRLALPAVALLAMAPLASDSYRWATPRTADVAGKRLAERLPSLEGRVVVVGEGIERLVVAKGEARAAIARLTPGETDYTQWRRRTDALVLRRDGAPAALPPELAAAAWVDDVEPRFGAVRGPALRLYLWRWSLERAPEAPRLHCVERGRWVATSEHVAGTSVSLAFWHPRARPLPALRIGGQPARLHATQEGRRRVLLFSEKVPSPATGDTFTVELDMPCRRRHPISVALLRWRPL